jgi:elongation factor G
MQPLVEIAIEPRLSADSEKFHVVLSTLGAIDPTFDAIIDRETGRIVMRAADERSLEIAIRRIRDDHGIDVNVGAPQVAYRETLGRKAEIDYTHKKQSGGSGQFARVKITFEPGEPGSGYSFENKIVGGSVPKEFIPGVEKGLEASRETGVLAGFPVIDFKATLTDGNYHDVDSSVLAFEIAARAAFREGLAKAQCKLLEPIMKVEVAGPAQFKSDVVDDLKSRGGRIDDDEAGKDVAIVHASVPLASMFGYANTLRSMTQGRAAYAMTFDRYAPVPLRPDDDSPFRPAMGSRA